MQYLYFENAGATSLVMHGDEHHYIFKVRRHRIGETLGLRSLKDDTLYIYKISFIDKKEAQLELLEERVLPIFAKRELHIGWCLIDSKNIEKVLPSLNEIGVTKITFITCKRSQQNIKLDIQRLNRIVLNSSQQCGRSRMMEFEISSSLKDFLTKFPQSHMLNFSQNHISLNNNIDTIVIGCEGGFSDDEVALFDENMVVGFNTPLILRSESAVCAVASNILI